MKLNYKTLLFVQKTGQKTEQNNNRKSKKIKEIILSSKKSL